MRISRARRCTARHSQLKKNQLILGAVEWSEPGNELSNKKKRPSVFDKTTLLNRNLIVSQMLHDRVCCCSILFRMPDEDRLESQIVVVRQPSSLRPRRFMNVHVPFKNSLTEHEHIPILIIKKNHAFGCAWLISRETRRLYKLWQRCKRTFAE